MTATLEKKICSSCDEVKVLDEFHKDRNRPDGRRSACKSCRSQKHAKADQAEIYDPPPPKRTPEEMKVEARARAIRDLYENYTTFFWSRYDYHLDQLGMQASWHGLN